jgi:hypothetical protein
VRSSIIIGKVLKQVSTDSSGSINAAAAAAAAAAGTPLRPRSKPLPVHQILENVPLQRNLSVQVLFGSKDVVAPPEDVLKFRRVFEFHKDIPCIVIIGSECCCTERDVFNWSASMTAGTRNRIILDQNSYGAAYTPVCYPNSFGESSAVNPPCTAVEFCFGFTGSDENPRTTRISIDTASSHAPSHTLKLDFRGVLEAYHDLYIEFLSSLYSDAVLLCNLCNRLPPDEMRLSYKTLCQCMRSILDDPKLVKDIENALSSSSFQSLIPQNSNRGFVWSLKPQNIFWQGVFAGSILSDVNESLVRNLENTDGLLKMRWIDSLKRVVLHYQLVGDSNLWASPACALLFSHEMLQSSASVHDLHRSPPPHTCSCCNLFTPLN